jgi:VanZ like family
VTISHQRGNGGYRLGVVITLAAIGLLTLLPDGGQAREPAGFACLFCDALSGADAVLNVALFIPLGLLFRGQPMSTRRVVGLAVLLSLSIELLQLAIPGRASSLRDVLANGAGGWLGAVLAGQVVPWLTPSRATTIRLWSAVSATLALTGMGGLALQPAPSAPPYYAHWAPRQGHLEAWSGQLRSATIDGVAIPPGPVAGGAALRDAMADGFELRVNALGGDRTRGIGGMFTISDGARREVLLVGPDGRDLVVRVRRRGADLHLDAPAIRFTGLLAAEREGLPLSLIVQVSRTGTCAVVNGTRDCHGPPASGEIRELIRPTATHGTVRILLNAISLALLVLPVGMLLRGARSLGTVLSCIFLLAGVAVAARLSGLALPTPAEWLGLLSGLVAGVEVSRLLLRSATRRVGDGR